MSKQRMRYRWWSALPRNVSQQEFDRLGLLNGGAVATGFLSVICLLFGVLGTPLRTSQELADMEAMSVAEAASYGGEPVDLVKLEGFLLADDASVMPDDDSLEVIQGEIQIVARATGRSESETTSETTEDSDAVREVLYEWSAEAESVYLSDGDERIALGFNLAKLPTPAAPVPLDQEPEVEKTGDGPRTQRPAAVVYADQVFPLEGDRWGTGYVAVDLERRALPQGQAALVVAGLEPGPEGNQLVDPLGNSLQVFLATEAELQENNRQSRRMLLVLWIPFAIASVLLIRSARRYYRELVEISNQA